MRHILGLICHRTDCNGRVFFHFITDLNNPHPGQSESTQVGFQTPLDIPCFFCQPRSSTDVFETVFFPRTGNGDTQKERGMTNLVKRRDREVGGDDLPDQPNGLL